MISLFTYKHDKTYELFNLDLVRKFIFYEYKSYALKKEDKEIIYHIQFIYTSTECEEITYTNQHNYLDACDYIKNYFKYKSKIIDKT